MPTSPKDAAAPDVVPRQTLPFNAETPMPVLAEPITPTRHFYVRNHFPVPRLDPAHWRLAVEGEVERPQTFTYEMIRRLPARAQVVTLECAGNGRTSLVPAPSGVPWAFGAVATAEFGGASLSSVLDAVGVKRSGREILFEGADRGDPGGGTPQPYLRSLPVDIARHPDTLLVWSMNGEPLTEAHGFPVRVIVPGWYGMAAVKWLVGVKAIAEPFTGYYQRDQYVYREQPGGTDGEPVSRMRVRAIIASPTEGQNLGGREIAVRGTAWSGSGSIRKVEVSTDGGRSWAPADLSPPASPYGATPWRFGWRAAPPGDHTLIARAEDEGGNRQPLDPVWNRLGYGNNGAQKVRVQVSGER